MRTSAFNKSPENLWNAVFNVFQGGAMTIAVSLYLGETALEGMLKTFVCAYCAGVMLTAFLNIPAFGAWAARLLRCEGKPAAGYIVSGAAGGALMGVLMDFFITFMAIGPVPHFPAAFLHTLPFAVLVSAVSSCCWIGLVNAVVKKVYGRGDQPERDG